MELQVGVKVLLKNTEGKYLLLLRSPKENVAQGKWDIPGGRIDAGSKLLDNLQREVTEETGMTLSSVPRLVGAQDIFIPQQDRHVVRLTYIGSAEGEPQLSEEHTEYRWMTFAEMTALGNLDSYLSTLIKDGTISEATHGY